MLDIAVIGAGLSGLVCARRLTEAGKRVIVLEASARVGGRMFGREIEGTLFDLGGQWLGPGQDRIQALTDELGIATSPTPHGGAHLLGTGKEKLRYRGTIPPMSLAALSGMGWALAQTYTRSWRVALDGSSTAAMAKWDEQTVEDLVGKLAPQGRAAFLAAFRTVFGAEPRDVSLLWYLFYLRAGGGFFKLVDVEGGAQERRFVGGAYSVPKRLAKELGEVVELDVPVRAIRQDDAGVEVVCDGRSVRAQYAVVALPPSMSKRIDFEPPMPAARGELAEKMRMGATVKMLALYDKPFWRDTGLSGQAATDGLLSVVFDNSMGEHHALVGFIVGDAARAWTDRDPEEREAAALAQLGELFGAAAGKPRLFVTHDWASEAWTGGCPVDSPPPRVYAGRASALRDPHGRVHWAGTETATQHAGYLDGAVSAGERAASEVIARLGSTRA